MAEPDKRISQLDGIRALAFLAVFFHHGISMPMGWMGVDVFFVLSGFLITRNLLELKAESTAGSSLRAFYFRRLIRITPPYYIAVTMVLLFDHAYTYDPRWYYTFTSNIHDAFVHMDGGQLRAMWSIAVEEQFYLVWPFLILFLPRRALPFAFAMLIVAAPGCRLLVQSIDREAVYRLTTSRMDLLAAGALLAYVDGRDAGWIRDRRAWFARMAVLSAITFVALAATHQTFRSQLNDPLFNVVGYSLSVAFCASVIAYVRSAQVGWLYGALRTPALQFVGRISYMAYLTHLLFLALFSKSFEKLPAATLALAATLSFSALSWFLVEKPLLGLRKLVPPSPIRTAPG